MIDLTPLSLNDLKQLQKDVATAIADFEARRKREALAAVEKAARDAGFSLSDLLSAAASRQGTGTRPKGDAKYAHPEDPSLTWSGRGRQPFWLKDLEAAGRNRSEFAI